MNPFRTSNETKFEIAESLSAVQSEGKARLAPSITNPNWLVLRQRRELFRKWMKKLNGDHLAVLDVGGRIQPYRPLLGGKTTRYVALDLRPSPLVNLLASAEQMPFADAQFDAVICSQVLEYVPNPATAISEIYRVLRPGGVLLLSVPAMFPRDSDQDSWRFLPAGITILLRRFSRVEIVPEGGSVAGFARTVAVGMDLGARIAFLRWLLRRTAVPALNLAAFSLESCFTHSNDQFAVNYSAVAQK